MRMDKIEIYKGFEIRAFEREQGRWRAEIRKAERSPLKILVGDGEHRMSITTTADTLAAETTIDEVKKAIDAGDGAWLASCRQAPVPPTQRSLRSSKTVTRNRNN